MILNQPVVLAQRRRRLFAIESEDLVEADNHPPGCA